jgi:hypothetical protein
MKSHKDLENYLDRYSGVILYMREMDEVAYGKLCAVRVSLAPQRRCLIPGFQGLFFCSEPTAQRSDNFTTFPLQWFH